MNKQNHIHTNAGAEISVCKDTDRGKEFRSVGTQAEERNFGLWGHRPRKGNFGLWDTDRGREFRSVGTQTEERERTEERGERKNRNGQKK